MTKKASIPLEDPPTPSSSDEEEISSEEEDEQISEEDEPNEPVTVNATAKQQDSDSDSEHEEDESNEPVTVNATAKQQDSDSDSEHEEDESEEPVTVTGSPNPRSGKAIAVTPSKDVAQSSGKKRRSEGTSTEVIAKRAKSGKNTAGTSLFKRLWWSEDDEITLLQHMIDFNADTGTSPSEDKDRFFEFVKKEISFDVSKSQVVEKIRSLKRKYIGNGKKRVEPSFSKAHDKECMRLAKYIWGSDGMVLEKAVKSKNVRSKANEKKKKKKVESVKPVEEDKEVLAHVAGDSGKKVEEEDKEVFTHSGGDKAVEEDDKEVFTHVGGDKAENDKEVFTHGGGDKAVEEDNEVFTHGGGDLGKKVVEEDKEVFTHGRGHSESLCVRELDWFEKSLLVQSFASFGVAEHSVKERWSLIPTETKKKLEHEWKSLQSKEFQVVSLKTRFMSELASLFAEAI